MSLDFDVAREQYENYRFCYDNGHDAWVKKAKQCFDFWNGKQWDDQTLAKLRREGRPALTLNVIESLVRSMKGIQCALRNDVRYLPVENANAESARVRDAIWLHVQNQNQLDFLETDVYEKGLIMDRAYYDMRMDYSKGVQGEIRIRKRRSQDVILDPSIDDYDPDEWPQVITRRWVSYNDLHSLYGKDKAQAVGLSEMPTWYDYEDIFMAQNMGRMPYYHHTRIGGIDLKNLRGHLLTERQYRVFKRKDVFVDTTTGDWSEIPENWERDRISRVLQVVPGLTTMPREVSTIRWTVTCEDELMHDEDSPYNHFTVVPYFPSFIDGVTMGAVEGLMDPQMLYNKITSSELHIISTTANSGWKVKTGVLKNMTIEELEQAGARTGFVAELTDMDGLEKVQPNQTPQGHDRLSFKADAIMRSLSGVSNQARGFAREDVAGEAIMANQAAQEVNFAGWLSNLHRTKQILARNVLDCAQTHYSETRVIQINRGSALIPNMEEVTVNQPTAEGTMLNDLSMGRYSTVLVPAPSRATLSEGDFKMLIEMKKLGIAVPDAMIVELSPAANKSQMIEQMGLGPDSNERQRQAEELAAQQQQVEQQKTLATARNQEAAAVLNQARAEKFAIEAASDPDASYERVEMARIESDAVEAAASREAKRQESAARLALDHKKAEDTKQFQNKQIAVRLAELDINREQAEADRVATQQDNAAARREKKPTSKKSK